VLARLASRRPGLRRSAYATTPLTPGVTEERESEGAGYFRYGNSARPFDKIQTYALARFALFVAKRHRQPSRPWREKPNADGEGRR